MDLRTHHAWCLVGQMNAGKVAVLDCLSDLGIGDTSPDVRWFEYEMLSVDDARTITKVQAERPVAENFSWIIVSFDRTTTEAQNALLKTLEEPASTTKIILIVPTDNFLLPTVRSRLQFVYLEDNQLDDFDVAAFLAMSFKDRLDAVAPIIKEGDKQQARQILVSMQKMVYEKGNTAENKNTLRYLGDCIEVVLDPSSSLKLLLESVAVTV